MHLIDDVVTLWINKQKQKREGEYLFKKMIDI